MGDASSSTPARTPAQECPALHVMWCHAMFQLADSDDITSSPSSSLDAMSSEGEGEGEGDVASIPVLKATELKTVSGQQRLIWTPSLHARFEAAVRILGIERAKPQAILQLMSVEGVTARNVKSHLQKYRLRLSKQHAKQQLQERGAPRDKAFDSLEDAASRGTPDEPGGARSSGALHRRALHALHAGRCVRLLASEVMDSGLPQQPRDVIVS